jgi:uncharacterized protein
MIRVVADTNVFISALLFGGLPAAFLDLAFEGAFLLITSPILLDELDDKLLNKFDLLPSRVDQIRTKFERTCELVSTTPSLCIVKNDPNDDRVLECAIAGRVSYVVTGDRHLLHLNSYGRLETALLKAGDSSYRWRILLHL